MLGFIIILFYGPEKPQGVHLDMVHSFSMALHRLLFATFATVTNVPKN